MSTFLIAGILLLLLWMLSGMVLAYFGSNRNGDMSKVLGAHQAGGSVSERIESLRKQTPERIDEEYDMVNREGIRLHGYLIRSHQPSNVYVFYSHGYRSPDGAMEFGALLPMWVEHDYNFFLVDHRGHGKSGGKHISFGIYEAEDNMEWLRFMTDHFGTDIQIILQGQSMGAATVLMMSGKALPDQVKFMIADCGYTRYYDVASRALSFPGSRPVLAAGNLYLSIVHGIDMKKAAPVDAVRSAVKPILFTHGEKDTLVPIEMGRTNYDACTAEKEFHSFSDAEHTTAPMIHPKEYVKLVDRFIQRYVH